MRCYDSAMTYQIIYSSVASTPMQAEDLEEILEHARRNNANSGITGALVYVDGYFVQILEGDSNHVRQLMDRISGDVRHETVTVLQAGEISTAAFSEWKMAYISATPEQVASWAGLTTPTELPSLFKKMHEDRSQASLVAKSILAVLLGEPDSAA
jgi:hypothetical protein